MITYIALNFSKKYFTEVVDYNFQFTLTFGAHTLFFIKRRSFLCMKKKKWRNQKQYIVLIMFLVPEMKKGQKSFCLEILNSKFRTVTIVGGTK